jgi:hypothetical protein
MMSGFSSSRRLILFAAVGGVMTRISALPASPERLPAEVDGHSSDLIAKVTLPGGASRSVILQGVGCPVSMCSRVAIKGTAGDDSLVNTWIDTIAAIQNTTADSALFVMKDGSLRSLAFLHDFRVLYVVDQSGRSEKLDLAKVESLEFLTPSAKQ